MHFRKLTYQTKPASIVLSQTPMSTRRHSPQICCIMRILQTFVRTTRSTILLALWGGCATKQVKALITVKRCAAAEVITRCACGEPNGVTANFIGAATLCVKHAPTTNGSLYANKEGQYMCPLCLNIDMNMYTYVRVKRRGKLNAD